MDKRVTLQLHAHTQRLHQKFQKKALHIDSFKHEFSQRHLYLLQMSLIKSILKETSKIILFHIN